MDQPSRESPDVRRVVDRFLESRRSGQRTSIDEVLDDFPDLPDRNVTRTFVLETISARKSSLTGDSSSENSASRHDEAEMPSLEGYYLIAQLGAGGMGRVYEAYQQATGRRVAVKYMLESIAGDSARWRFEREVEFVARLQHPSIVAVLDSGIHRGRYYYVMDYVEGKSLDEAFPPGRSNVRDVFKVLSLVCDAVDYAHQRGVIHRDLKPSNILIDDRGQPHLLDFGLAKAIDPDSTQTREITLSQPGQVLGTLGYMSPEQSRGQLDEMSVRSDVYSLGAIAYELVTGKLPCGTHGSLGDILNRIANEEPSRPSMVGKLRDADIDAILMKALEKSPNDRYATVGELAADMRHYLADEPIVARPVAWPTRFLRWTRRNRAVASVAALSLLIIVALIGVFIARIIRERDLAQATLQAQLGTDRLGRSMYPEAESYLSSALSLRRRLLRPPDPELAQSLHDSARLRYFQDDIVAALELYQEALDMRKALFDSNHKDVVTTQLHIAACYDKLEKPAEAELLYRQVLETRKRIYGEEHLEVAAGINNLGDCLRSQHRYSEAETLFRESLRILKLVTKGKDHEYVAKGMHNVATCLIQLGNYSEAEEFLKDSLAMKRKLFPDMHPSVADGLAAMAELKLRQKDCVGAESWCLQALDIQRELFKPGHRELLKSEELLEEIHKNCSDR